MEPTIRLRQTTARLRKMIHDISPTERARMTGMIRRMLETVPPDMMDDTLTELYMLISADPNAPPHSPGSSVHSPGYTTFDPQAQSSPVFTSEAGSCPEACDASEYEWFNPRAHATPIAGGSRRVSSRSSPSRDPAFSYLLRLSHNAFMNMVDLMWNYSNSNSGSVEVNDSLLRMLVSWGIGLSCLKSATSGSGGAIEPPGMGPTPPLEEFSSVCSEDLCGDGGGQEPPTPRTPIRYPRPRHRRMPSRCPPTVTTVKKPLDIQRIPDDVFGRIMGNIWPMPQVTEQNSNDRMIAAWGISGINFLQSPNSSASGSPSKSRSGISPCSNLSETRSQNLDDKLLYLRIKNMDEREFSLYLNKVAEKIDQVTNASFSDILKLALLDSMEEGSSRVEILQAQPVKRKLF